MRITQQQLNDLNRLDDKLRRWETARKAILKRNRQIELAAVDYVTNGCGVNSYTFPSEGCTAVHFGDQELREQIVWAVDRCLAKHCQMLGLDQPDWLVTALFVPGWEQTHTAGRPANFTQGAK